MTDHPRKLIRQKIKNLLIGKTVAGTNVFTNRTKPLVDLPILLIYLKSEPAEVVKDLPIKREAEILIELIDKVGDDLDDRLDDEAYEIEKELQGNEYLDGLVENIDIINTDIRLIEEGTKRYGSLLLTYRTRYYTRKFI